MHHDRPNQHVLAALALCASVALLFWYVLRIVMAFAGEDYAQICFRLARHRQ